MSHAEQVELMNVCMLVQDRVDPSWPVLCFPGGHVELGEDCADAVIRELQEETGLTVLAPYLVGIKEWHRKNGRAIVLLYRAERREGTLFSSDEGENRWMTREEIAVHPRGKNLMEFLPAYDDERITEISYEEAADGWHAVYR